MKRFPWGKRLNDIVGKWAQCLSNWIKDDAGTYHNSASWFLYFNNLVSTYTRTATDMDGTLHTDFCKSETSREIKK